MMSNYVLPEISISKLICFNCKKPLSRFPIYITEAKPSCGRCERPQNGYRFEFFEEIVKNLQFPCCYKEKGCLEILLPKNVADHERHCKFQTFFCPFKCPNKWKGFAQDFLEHAKKEHPTSLLTDDCCFEVDFKNTHYQKKLMPYLDGLYVIKYRCFGPNRILSFNFKQFGYEPVDDNLNYKITFENSGKQLNHTVFVDFNATFRIKKSKLDIFLENPAKVFATIEVLQNHPDSVTKNVNTELLKHFKCIVCKDYLIGPIYSCATGHSICQPCKDQITVCPICKSQIQTTRNYTLERMISDFEFPCKSDKCLFVGKGTLIKNHQETCNFIEKDCPLKESYGCEKKFLYADLSDHIYKEHNKYWYKGQVISCHLTLHKKYEGVFFSKYCSKLFRLNFSYQNELFTFFVKLMDSSEKTSKYRFVVEILDTENTNRLCCSKNLKVDEQEIQIHLVSIEHLIHLSFNFRMFVQEY